MKKKDSGGPGCFAGIPVTTENLKNLNLSPSEERMFSEIISLYHDFPDLGDQYPIGIPDAESRLRESAARAAIPFLFREFEKNYRREEILGALATAVSLPLRFLDDPGLFNADSALTGAAYWLLDYFEKQDLYDELERVLPIYQDDRETRELDENIPHALDTAHSRKTLLRLMRVLKRREKPGNKKICRKLWSWLDKKDAENLKTAFLDATVDYYGRFLEVRTRMNFSENSALKSSSNLQRPPLNPAENPTGQSAAGFPGAPNPPGKSGGIPIAPAAPTVSLANGPRLPGLSLGNSLGNTPRVPLSFPNGARVPGPPPVSLPDNPRSAKTLPAGLADGFRASRSSSLEIIPPRESAASDPRDEPADPRDLLPFPMMKKLTRDHSDLVFLIKTPSLIGLSEERIQEELYYRRMTGLLSGFTVRDPYAICAAWLLLEHNHDLLLNLGVLTSSPLIRAERLLPWSPITQYAQTAAPLRDAAAEIKTPDYTPRYLSAPIRDANQDSNQDLKSNPDANPDLNQDSKADEPYEEESRLLSESQLFYIATGNLLPRDRIPSGRLSDWFQSQGLSPERAQALAYAAHIFSRLDDARARDEIKISRDMAGQARNQEQKQEQTQKQNQTQEQNQARNQKRNQDANPAADSDSANNNAGRELSRQLKEARQAVYEANQNVRQLQERLKQEETRSARDRMELNGLRETIFRMKSGEVPENRPADENIEFPWQCKRRILIFGGHDTWSKSIRPLLPGARFFDRESLPDLNAIKGADVVWIQANALSHKFYYRIIDAARKENIPVQYFGFASARKCAEQLVFYELSGGASEEL